MTAILSRVQARLDEERKERERKRLKEKEDARTAHAHAEELVRAIEDDPLIQHTEIQVRLGNGGDPSKRYSTVCVLFSGSVADERDKTFHPNDVRHEGTGYIRWKRGVGVFVAVYPDVGHPRYHGYSFNGVGLTLDEVLAKISHSYFGLLERNKVVLPEDTNPKPVKKKAPIRKVTLLEEAS